MRFEGLGFRVYGLQFGSWGSEFRVCGEDDLEKVVSLLDEVGECGSGINGSVVVVLIVRG